MPKLRWPLHPRPLQEECILSWVTRIAYCYNFSLDEFLENDLGFHGNINELNFKAPDWLLELLAERTGNSKQNIYGMTLSSFIPFLFEDIEKEHSDFESYVHHYSLLIPSNKRKKLFPKKLWTPWQSQLLNFANACPICIASKPILSMLTIWYLPILLSCPIHKCYLRQCIAYQGTFCCWKNENDLLGTPSLAVQKMDQRTWSAITTGQVKLPNRTVHCGVWFRLLRTMLDELHVAVSSLNKFYANMISEIWTSLNLEPRAGQKIWCPYELLSFEKQKKTLIAAATAMEKIENRTIIPNGRDTYLFLPEPLSDYELLSYSIPASKNVDSSWKKLHEMINNLLNTAKQNQSEAISLRNFLLFGKSDSESIQKVENILLDAGVPIEFLVT